MSSKGYKQSDEHKKKIAISNTGKKQTEEHKKKMVETRKKNNSYIAWNKGRKETRLEVIEKIRMSAKKRPAVSIETRKKLADACRGERAPAWKGGITPINEQIRHSFEYRLWRKSVFERDNWTCVWCGIRSKKGIKVYLHADHIKPFSLFPELRFAIDNGRTLCVECHRKTDTYGYKCINYNCR